MDIIQVNKVDIHKLLLYTVQYAVDNRQQQMLILTAPNGCITMPGPGMYCGPSQPCINSLYTNHPYKQSRQYTYAY